MRDGRVIVEGVSHRYGRGPAAVKALVDVRLEFRSSHLALVMGPSGSGKTTLLMVLGCLLTPDAGDVRVLGEAVRLLGEAEKAQLRRQRLGFVYQSFRLFNSLSAVENVLVALEINGQRGRNARLRAMSSLEAVGLADRASHRPSELSGGQKQRVALARALVNDPAVVLADEPTAALDSTSGEQVARILRRLADEEGRIVIVVSHDPRLRPFAHQTIEMRDGAVARVGELAGGAP